jgi:hypothetical protein
MTKDQNYVQGVLYSLSDQLPTCDRTLLNLYALLVMTKGVKTSLKDVHDAWALWRNITNPDHRSLIPFDQLNPAVQELDREYMNAIHVAAWEIPS